MALFVKFPGTTDHMATDDINILDADTAHLVQSIGQWTGVGATLTDEGIQADGYGKYNLAVTGGANDRAQVLGSSFAITSGVDHIYSVEIDNGEAAAVNVRFIVYVDEGIALDQTLSVPTGVSTQSITGVLTGAEITRLWINPKVATTTFGYSKVCIREGTDPTFQPSLDIVGVLDETITPSDMPVVYVKGSPLTVGAGWAGDGYEYTRRDGIGGPIVAQFLPDDLP